jgi:hypothetical protein
MVELLEDVVGADALRHLRGARPGKKFAASSWTPRLLPVHREINGHWPQHFKDSRGAALSDRIVSVESERHLETGALAWLVVLIVRWIILQNRKWFRIASPNSNTFHVQSFVRFEGMQQLFKFILKHLSNIQNYNIFWKQNLVLVQIKGF